MSKFLYLSSNDMNKILENKEQLIIDTMEKAFTLYDNGNVIQPDKISIIMDKETQNRINCMPSHIDEIQTCGMKWVSVFPSNREVNVANVEGMTILSETATGKLKCMMNSTEITSLRTAGAGAIAAKYLAKKDSQTIGFIGAGEEARAHFRMIKHVMPSINCCYVSSRTSKSTKSFIDELSSLYKDVKFVDCHDSYEEATKDVDIIVTAISSQEQVLKSQWVSKGTLYIHVAGIEDEYDVALKSSKIICDSWECVKHRAQTISKMYQEGILKDSDIYANISEIILGTKNARENQDEIIYFNSVGLATVDVLLSEVLYNYAVEQGNYGVYIEK